MLERVYSVIRSVVTWVLDCLDLAGTWPSLSPSLLWPVRPPASLDVSVISNIHRRASENLSGLRLFYFVSIFGSFGFFPWENYYNNTGHIYAKVGYDVSETSVYLCVCMCQHNCDTNRLWIRVVRYLAYLFVVSILIYSVQVIPLKTKRICFI
jgi:hypothetical protein